MTNNGRAQRAGREALEMKKKLLRALPWMILAAAYLFSVGYWGLFGAHNLNSDDSAEMILAAQLNEEGGIVSENWCYSTELRLASPVQVYQMTLRLFPDNWQAARTIAAAVIVLGVLGSVLYALTGLGLRKSVPWLGTIMVLPFSGVYSWLVIFQCHYSMHVILSFLMLGMLARCMRPLRRRRRLALYAGLTVLALAGGLNGVRMMTMFVVPVFAAAAVTAALACRAHATFREAGAEPDTRAFFPAFAVLAAAGAGYVVNMRVLSRRYAYYNYGLESLQRFSLNDFLHQLDGMVDMFGYQAGAPFFSLKGISGCIGFLIVVLLFLGLARMLCRFGALSAPLRLLTLTTLFALALGMTLNVVLGQALVRYYMVGILLLMVTLAAEIETEPCRNGALRGMAGLAVVGCLLCQTGCGMLYGYRQGRVNYEMAADWLLEHGYTQGYATYWNAYPIEEASDGRITMRALDTGSWEQLNLFSLNSSRTRMREEPEGPVFLLVDEVQNLSGSPLLDSAHLATEEMIGWSYYVYVYDSAQQLRALAAGD